MIGLSSIQVLDPAQLPPGAVLILCCSDESWEQAAETLAALPAPPSGPVNVIRLRPGETLEALSPAQVTQLVMTSVLSN